MPGPRYFTSPLEFREWLHANHATATELFVGFYRKGTGHPTMTWSDSVDEALCYGWIDGVRHSVDTQRYSIRFTPRAPRSIWSKVNLAKVQALSAEDRLHPAGLAAWERRTPERSGIYAFEQASVAFDAGMEQRFRRHRAAWRFFEAQPPGYRKLATNWVITAKRAETRERRFAALLVHCTRHERLPQYVTPPRRA